MMKAILGMLLIVTAGLAFAPSAQAANCVEKGSGPTDYTVSVDGCIDGAQGTATFVYNVVMCHVDKIQHPGTWCLI